MPLIVDTVLYVFLFLALYFQVFLLITFFENKSVVGTPRGKAPRLAHFPSVTVIVPCWNEEQTLAKTMHSLLTLNYPKDKLSIMIVDDGSTDGTPAVAKQFESHPQVRVFRKGNGGKHTALNLGLAHTKSDLVGCLDADSYVHPDALLRIVKLFENPAVEAVTPAIVIHEPKTIIQHIQKTEYNMGVFLRKMFSILDALQVTPGPFSFFRTSVFSRVGKYRHAHHTEDMEMALRMQSHGMKIENAHEAHVYTTGPATWRKLYRQRIRWTYGFLMNLYDYRYMIGDKRYGNLGTFVLPGAVISIFAALYFTSMLLMNATKHLVEKIAEIQTIGFHPSFGFGNFEWFAVNTQMAVFLSLFLFLSSLMIIFLGKKMSENSWRVSRDFFYYVFFYGFLAPFWLAKAVYSATVSRKVSWR